VPDGVWLALRLTPCAACNGVDGIVADADGRLPEQKIIRANTQRKTSTNLLY